MKIGKGCVFREPRTARIDMTRPWLISIGDNVDMNRYFQIWTHDWASGVFIHKYGQMINSSGKVTIGNNVYFGANVTVLKGVTIGDNCVIGACSVVTRDIPSNSVAVGNPCRVVCSLDKYYERRKQAALNEAVEDIRSFSTRYGRAPYEKELVETKIFYQENSQLPRTFSSYKQFIEYCINT